MNKKIIYAILNILGFIVICNSSVFANELQFNDETFSQESNSNPIFEHSLRFDYGTFADKNLKGAKIYEIKFFNRYNLKSSYYLSIGFVNRTDITKTSFLTYAYHYNELPIMVGWTYMPPLTNALLFSTDVAIGWLFMFADDQFSLLSSSAKINYSANTYIGKLGINLEYYFTPKFAFGINLGYRIGEIKSLKIQTPSGNQTVSISMDIGGQYFSTYVNYQFDPLPSTAETGVTTNQDFSIRSFRSTSAKIDDTYIIKSVQNDFQAGTPTRISINQNSNLPLFSNQFKQPVFNSKINQDQELGNESKFRLYYGSDEEYCSANEIAYGLEFARQFDTNNEWGIHLGYLNNKSIFKKNNLFTSVTVNSQTEIPIMLSWNHQFSTILDSFFLSTDVAIGISFLTRDYITPSNNFLTKKGNSLLTTIGLNTEYYITSDISFGFGAGYRFGAASLTSTTESPSTINASLYEPEVVDISGRYIRFFISNKSDFLTSKRTHWEKLAPAKNESEFDDQIAINFVNPSSVPGILFYFNRSKRNPEREIIGYQGINIGFDQNRVPFGYTDITYLSPLEMNALNLYVSYGTIVYIFPYVGLGIDYQTKEGLFIGAGIMTVSLSWTNLNYTATAAEVHFGLKF